MHYDSVNLKDIMQSERIQSQNTMYLLILYV